MEPIVVKKPWGFEYLAFQNEHVAIWILHINKNHMTSLHCHPSKMTGLIVVSGEIQINFLNGSTGNLNALSNRMIYPGRFHQSHALTDNTVLLEIETPVDKNDIIRIHDNYGRENEEYKYDIINVPDDISGLFISEKNHTIERYGLNFMIERGSLDWIQSKLPSDIIIILKGNIIKYIENKCHNVMRPGTIITIESLNKVYSHMSGYSDDFLYLSIRKI